MRSSQVRALLLTFFGDEGRGGGGGSGADSGILEGEGEGLKVLEKAGP